MIIGTLLRNALKKEALARAIPLAKKILVGAGKIAVKEAAVSAGEKAVGGIKSAPRKVEAFVNKQKSEFLDEAESRAYKFVTNQMEILDRKIDKKIVAAENKFDEKIRSLFWLFLVTSFVVMVLAGLTFATLLKYFN